MDLPVTVFDWWHIIQICIFVAIPFTVSFITLYELWLNDIDFDQNIERVLSINPCGGGRGRAGEGEGSRGGEREGRGGGEKGRGGREGGEGGEGGGCVCRNDIFFIFIR